jgi:exopolysaccharide production protein ExoQ
MNASIRSADVIVCSGHAQARSASAMPLATLIGFYLSSRLVFVLMAVRVFRQEAEAGVAASLALNYLLLAVVAFYAFGPASRTLRSMLDLPCFRWALLFLAFSGISLLWSVTASLPAAAAFWGAMAADTGMVVLLLRNGEIDSVVSSLMRGYIWGTCAIAILAWLLPAQTDLRLGDEELLGPNQIGWVCAFAFFFAQYLTRTKNGSWILPGLLLAVTLLRSLSKTSIIAFIAGQAYILLRDRSMSRGRKLLWAFSALAVMAVFSSLLTNYFDVYSNAGAQPETLTGRVGIWAYIVNEAVDKPWFGHGFHSVWKVIPPFYSEGFEARHAHNELLQQFYAYGAIGVLLLITIYSSVYRQVRRLSDPSLRIFLLGMLVFVLVRGLADTEAFDLSLPVWFIAMLGALVQQSRSREACA